LAFLMVCKWGKTMRHILHDFGTCRVASNVSCSGAVALGVAALLAIGVAPAHAQGPIPNLGALLPLLNRSALPAGNRPVVPARRVLGGPTRDAARPDPTLPSAELRALLAADEQKQDAPQSAAPALPPIKVLGRVSSRGFGHMATLMVGESKMTVRAGREYFVSANASAQPLSFIVHGIAADGVDIEIRPTGQRMVLP
jgi:hypothetical protein